MRFSRTHGAGMKRFDPLGFASRHFRRVVRKMAYYFKRYGWKIGVLIFIYYLVRDTILYIIVPMLIARELGGG